MSKFFKCVVIFNELKVQQKKKDREQVRKNVYKIMSKIIWRRAEQKLLWSTFCFTMGFHSHSDSLLHFPLFLILFA